MDVRSLCPPDSVPGSRRDLAGSYKRLAQSQQKKDQEIGQMEKCDLRAKALPDQSASEAEGGSQGAVSRRVSRTNLLAHLTYRFTDLTTAIIGRCDLLSYRTMDTASLAGCILKN